MCKRWDFIDQDEHNSVVTMEYYDACVAGMKSICIQQVLQGPVGRASISVKHLMCPGVIRSPSLPVRDIRVLRLVSDLCACLQQAMLDSHKSGTGVVRSDPLASLLMSTPSVFAACKIKQRGVECFGPIQTPRGMTSAVPVNSSYWVAVTSRSNRRSLTQTVATTDAFTGLLVRNNKPEAYEGFIILLTVCCAYHDIKASPEVMHHLAMCMVTIGEWDGLLTTSNWHTPERVGWYLSTSTNGPDGLAHADCSTNQTSMHSKFLCGRM